MVASKMIRVVGLHKLPFDPAGFRREMDSVKDHLPEVQDDLRRRYRRNWDNARLVVVEWDGPPDQVSFNGFSHGAGVDISQRQVPWLEQVIEAGSGRTRAAFFLHYVDAQAPLFYGNDILAFPPPSAGDPALIAKMDYASPD